MDYDDDEFQGQNRQLAGEGCSKVSPVLHPYALPKFDFDDTLHEHLSFNSIVENEVFLGQEDNQWIEDYSRGSSRLEFSSSGVESRHNNVWSEAASSESVEMLLKSVGQEENVVGKAVFEQLDPNICNETMSLAKAMNPNLNQESQTSGGELDSVITNEKHDLSVLEEKVDNTLDVIQKDPNTANVGVRVEEFNAIALSEIVSSGAAEESVQIKENSTVDGDTMIVESCMYSTEKSVSFVPNVEYADKPSAETSNLFSENPSAETSKPFSENPSDETTNTFDENPTSENSIPFSETPSTESSLPSIKTNISFSEKPPAESSITLSESPSQKLKNPNSPKSDAGSLSKMSPINISFTKENETDIEKDAQQIISATSTVSTTETCCDSSGSVQVDCKVISSEPGVAHKTDQDDSLNEKVDTSLPRESNDMNSEAVRALDSQKNVETSLLSEGSTADTITAYNFQSDVSVRVGVAAVSDQRSSPDTATAENDEQPKSPIFGVSLVHQGSKDKIQVGCPDSQNEFSQVESVVPSVLKNPSSLVEKDASPGLAEKAVREIDARPIEQGPGTKNGSQDCFKKTETNSSDSLEKAVSNSLTGCLQAPKESTIEVNKSNEHQTFVDVARPSDDVADGSSLPSMTTDDVQNSLRSVSVDNATPEEKNLTFEVNKQDDLGQDGKGSLSYPTSQVSNLPKIIEGPSKDNQMDPKKFHEVSVSPSGLTSQLVVKGKSERKPRRKSTGKENVRKGTSPARGEISPVLLTSPATSKVTRFEGVVLPAPKIPDLNNSTSTFQQPFTDNQQVQLRAQILVYGSLISGSPPEETHMIAAFGQSDGGRIWEGVWRACVERLHVQPKSSTPIQSRSDMRDTGSRTDEVTKHASVQNKIPSSPVGGPNNKSTPPFVSPMIPFSSPLWNAATPSDKAARFDFHQTPSPLRPAYQTPPAQNYNSWLSFSGQWLAASPIPTFNPTPRFPSLPITDSVKITPVKELGGGSVVKHTSDPPVLNSTPIILPDTSSVSGMKRSTISSDQPSGDSKSRKKRKGAPVVSMPCSTSVAISTPLAFMTTSKSSPVKFLSAVASPTHHTSGDQNMVISEETLTKLEESKQQAKKATEHADNAMFHCNGVWRQVESCDLNPNDEAKLVSAAVSVAAAASVAKVAAAAAKIASDIAEQARSNLSKSKNVASTSSLKHDENHLDAIVKAAELAAEAVSQAGKIVAMTEPFSLRDLIKAGPEGYWKTPQLAASKQRALIAENLNAETAPDKGILAENPTMEVDGSSVLLTSHESEDRSAIAGEPELKTSSGNFIESDIKEGCLVEVHKDDDKHNRAWFGANVLSLKDGNALVSYTEIQSDDGSGKLKEWLPLEVEGSEVPKIRRAHPVTTMQGTRKRRRTAATDFMWSSGDRVDVWMQNHWREGVVMETNKIDVTSLTVKFPGQGETSVVRSWFVRPTLIWKDGKWIMSHASEMRLSSPGGNMPQEKRLKLGSPIVESKAGSSENIDIVDLRKEEESRPLSLSTHERVFSVGSSRNNKVNASRTVRSGLQKEGPGVTFGVPKPGKNQKFMDVSKHYVADGSSITAHDSIKFTKYLIPHPPGSSRGWKNSSRRDPKVAETKPQMLKARKPPVPSFRTLSSKSTINKSRSLDSVSDSENQSGQQIQMEHGSSSTIEDKPERLNKRKFATPIKAAKFEKSLPEVAEPRRSNRKIQPTSRLLEGLQSSMSISKIPAVSHSTHRKVTPIQKETGTRKEAPKNS